MLGSYVVLKRISELNMMCFNKDINYIVGFVSDLTQDS